MMYIISHKHLSFFYLFSILLLIASCKHKPKYAIEKTWHAIALESKEMDSVLVQGQQFIDTVGTNTNADQNLLLYGSKNIDSVKKVLQVQLDSIKIMKNAALESTIFRFGPDSVAYLSFSGRTDSMKWYKDTDSTILLTPLGLTGTLDEIKMTIIQLNEKQLKLKFMENGASSIVTFAIIEK